MVTTMSEPHSCHNNISRELLIHDIFINDGFWFYGSSFSWYDEHFLCYGRQNIETLQCTEYHENFHLIKIQII